MDSDYDILVLLEEEIPFIEKRQLVAEAQRNLAQAGIPNDLIVQSIRQFEELKSFTGNVAHAAAVEGVPI